MSSQSHRASMVEVISGTLAGLLIAVLANWLLLPLWGFAPPLWQSFEIGLIFTLISLVRGCVFRRVFEGLRVSGILP